MKKMILLGALALTLLAPGLRAASFSYAHASSYNYGILPTNYAAGDDTTILNMYTAWKASRITDDGTYAYTKADQDNNYTYSEGMGYAMIMAAYMNDQTLFNHLWAYKLKWNDGNGLMNWKINGESGIVGSNSATDADQDIAYSLMIAGAVWGNAGAYNYASLALTELNRIRSLDLDNYAVRPGDAFDSCRYPSYFMVSQYQAYAAHDTGNASLWGSVRTQCYSTLNNTNIINSTSHLIPETCQDASTGGGCSDSTTDYKYNSCRVPYRVAMDWLYYGNASASSYLGNMANWLSSQSAGSIGDDYVVATNAKTSSGNNGAFVGPFTCAFTVNSTYQANLNSYYTALLGLSDANNGSYFNGAWQLQSLMLLSGHMPNVADPATIYTHTNTPTATPYNGTPTQTYTATPVPSGLMYEDFEEGAVPYVFDYVNTAGVIGAPAVVYQAPAYAGNYSLKEVITTVASGGYSGFGFTSNNNDSSHLFNASNATAVSFFVRCNEAVSFKFDIHEGQAAGHSGDQEGWDSVNQSYTAAQAGTWVQYTIPLTTGATGNFAKDLYMTYCNPAGSCTTCCSAVGNGVMNLDSIKEVQIAVQTAPISTAMTFEMDNVSFIMPTNYTPTVTSTPFIGQYHQIFDDFESPLSLSKTPKPAPFPYCGGSSDTTTVAKFGWSLDSAAADAYSGTSAKITFTSSTGWGNSVWLQSPYSDPVHGWFDASGAVYLGFYMNAPVGTRFQVEYLEDTLNAASQGQAWIGKYNVVQTSGWQYYQYEIGKFILDSYTTTWTVTGVPDLKHVRWVSLKIPGNETTDGPIYLDNVQFITSMKTATPSQSPTPNNFTPTPSFTRTPSPSPSPTGSNTPTITPSRTPSPSPTGSNTPSSTGTPSNTPSPSPSRTGTSTNTPAGTVSDTPTGTASGTPSATPTSTRTSTSTGTPSSSVTPSSTRTDTATSTDSPTASDTPTPTPTFSDVPVGSTLTDTPTISPTNTVSPSSTGTGSPTDTATHSRTPTSTSTVTVGNSPTSTSTSTVTVGNSPTSTSTVTVGNSPTSTSTVTLGNSPTSTSTVTVGNSPTSTSTVTLGNSPTSTSTITLGNSPTSSRTITLTITPSATPTFSNTRTATSTSTNTITPSATPTFSNTATPTATADSSATVSPTATDTGVPSTGQGTVDKIWVVPNPVFVAPGQVPRLYYHSTGKMDTLLVKIYTRAYTAVQYWHLPVNRAYAGWDSQPLPALSTLPAGTYFVVAGASDQKSLAHVALVILK
jgi:hypothetical protein